MRPAEMRQDEPQHLLGAGLAHRSRDSDDARLRARARRHAQPLHGAKRVVDGEDRPEGGELARPRLRNQGRGGAGGKGGRDMVVAVMDVALDGDEEIAGRQRAGVDRHAVHAGQGRAGQPQHVGEFSPGP